jgi:uncharacterized membrane protein
MKNKVLRFVTDNYITFCVYALIGWIYEVTWYLVVRNKFVNRGVLFGPFLPIYGFGLLILLLLLKRFMKKKHITDNIIYSSMAIFTVVTFITVTIIEYTVSPKIHRVDYLFKDYGILLFGINIFAILLVNLYIKKSKNKKIKKIDTTPILIFLAIWIITTIIEYVAHYIIDVYTGKLLWDYSEDFLQINSRVNWDASRNFAIGGTVLLYTVQPILDKFLTKTKFNKKIIISLIIGIPMILDFLINVVIK